MNSRILIMAAGKAMRFNGEIKQLLPVKGEPIIVRTIRQLAARGHEPIIITQHDEIKAISPRWFEPENRERLADSILSTIDLWKEHTAIFLGDVIYSKPAIDSILARRNPLMFHGNTWEVFALTFNDHYCVRVGLETVPYPGKLGTLHSHLANREDSAEFRRTSGTFTTIGDWTGDVDSLSEYENRLISIGMGNIDDATV